MIEGSLVFLFARCVWHVLVQWKTWNKAKELFSPTMTSLSSSAVMLPTIRLGTSLELTELTFSVFLFYYSRA